MADDQGRRIAVKPARKPSDETASAADWMRARSQAMAEIDDWKADARPVVIVDVDLPLSSVFSLYVQFAIVQGLVALVVIVALKAFGVF